MEKLKRHKIGLFSVIMLALNSLIGSGWLFGSGSAAQIAGPAAILSWILGAVIIISIALTYVELGSMFPESGGMSRYAQYSHGPLLGFVAAWANWISLVTLVPMEAVAAVQYMSSWPWSWANWTKNFIKNGSRLLGLAALSPTADGPHNHGHENQTDQADEGDAHAHQAHEQIGYFHGRFLRKRNFTVCHCSPSLQKRKTSKKHLTFS